MSDIRTSFSVGLDRIVDFAARDTKTDAQACKHLDQILEEAETLKTLLDGPLGLPKDAPVVSVEDVTDTLYDCAEAMANCLVVMGQYGAEESSAYRITEHRLKVASALLAKLEAAR